MSGCFGVVAGLSHGLLRQVLDEKEQREPATAFFSFLFFLSFFLSSLCEVSTSCSLGGGGKFEDGADCEDA